MTVRRMDNVGIVVADIDAAIEFFTELGLELEGRAPIEGEWAGRVTGLRDMRVEMAMMRTPNGHSRIELSRFLAPPVVYDHRTAAVDSLGYLRVMFTVDGESICAPDYGTVKPTPSVFPRRETPWPAAVLEFSIG